MANITYREYCLAIHNCNRIEEIVRLALVPTRPDPSLSNYINLYIRAGHEITYVLAHIAHASTIPKSNPKAGGSPNE